LVNVLFVGNTAGGNGSAIDLGSPDQVELVHTTIASPTVGAGTAIYVRQGTANITNTLVASYTTSIQQAGGTVNSDYNLFYDAPTTVTIGSHSLTGINPLFVNPASDNYRLTVGSPAAGAGINVGVATDLDGVTRPDPPAIGAYEVSLCFATVDGVTIYSSADASAVQQAVDAATAGDTVKIAGTCAGVQARGGTTQTVHISQALTLAGGYTTTNWTTPYPITQPTTLDAKSRGRVVLATVDITLSDLTIQNGSAATGQGGGLYTAGSVTLTNLSVLSNTASSGGGAYAIGAATLTGGLFQNNHAGYGGGLRTNGTLTLTGTQFLSDTATQDGGGVWAGGAATLSGGLFQNNRAGWGGGLFASSTFTLTGTQFLSNTATYWGGGAYAAGAATLLDSVFQNNRAGYGGGLRANGTLTLTGMQFLSNTATQDGGGVWAGGAATLSGGLFQNNRAGWGGGLFASSTFTLTGTQFLSNTATYWGGGAYVWGAATLLDSVFQNNHASYGGGLYQHASGDGRLVNTLFVGNAASDNGSALYLGSPGQVTLVHTTIASRTVGAGAAIYVYSGTVNITNTLVASYTTSIQQTGGTVNLDYNLFFNAPTTVTIGNHSLTGTNPLFVNPAGEDYRLAVGSPAAGKGLNLSVATDLDGNPRHDPPTIGAYEGSSFVITPTAGVGGVITPGTPQAVDYGGSATFTLTADTGYHIVDVGVDGASVGVTTTYTFNNVTADHTITATFDLLPPVYYTLTVNQAGTGSGTVTKSPDSISYTAGTIVTLTASANAGSTFVGWGGACYGPGTVLLPSGQCVVPMTANLLVTATFDLLPPAYYTLTVNTIGQGEVTRAPSQTTYLSGTVVTLTAVPAAGWYLEQWSGDASGTLTQTTVTMNANKAVTATFAQSSSCTPVSGPSLIYAPQSPLVGQTVTFTGTVSAGTTPITYTWAWGDGTPGGVGATLSHTFPLTVTAQSYTVTLSVSNACSGPVAAMQVVAVTPRRIFLPLVLR
jgi:hypothetical protein